MNSSLGDAEHTSFIYSCVSNPERWPIALSETLRCTGSEAVVLAQAPLAHSTPVMAAGAIARNHMAGTQTAPLLFSAEETASFPNELVFELDLGFAPNARSFKVADHSFGLMIGFRRGDSLGQYSEGDIVRCGTLLPHLARAMRLTAENAVARLDGWIDALAKDNLAIFGLDSERRVVCHSACLHAFSGGGFSVHTGRLRIADNQAQAQLDRHLAEALNRAPDAEPDELRAVVARNEGHPVLIAAVPAFAPPAPLALFSKVKALVIVKPVAGRSHLTQQNLQNTFQLTAAEAKTVIRLLQGLTPEQIGADMNLRTNTVRQYIKSAMSKTGVSRQIDLLTLLMRID